MGNILGKNLKMTVAGESHGDYFALIIDNYPCGVKIDCNYIDSCLLERRPQFKGETKRVENDNYKIVSGVFNNYTTGAPITILISNENKHSEDYEKNKFLCRPSHADYTGFMKYHKFNDYRGGGHFSGRLTALFVVAGSICDFILDKYGIVVKSHIKSIGDIYDKQFNKDNIDDIKKDICILKSKKIKVIDNIEEIIGKSF